jgi:hypothetical protein
MSLDLFLPPRVVKPKLDSEVFVEERCANPACRRVLKITEPKYMVVVKGKMGVYCRDCARALLPKPKPADSSGEEVS